VVWQRVKGCVMWGGMFLVPWGRADISYTLWMGSGIGFTNMLPPPPPGVRGGITRWCVRMNLSIYKSVHFSSVCQSDQFSRNKKTEMCVRYGCLAFYMENGTFHPDLRYWHRRRLTRSFRNRSKFINVSDDIRSDIMFDLRSAAHKILVIVVPI
jgi:hypothetical protein